MCRRSNYTCTGGGSSYTRGGGSVHVAIHVHVQDTGVVATHILVGVAAIRVQEKVVATCTHLLKGVVATHVGSSYMYTCTRRGSSCVHCIHECHFKLSYKVLNVCTG